MTESAETRTTRDRLAGIVSADLLELVDAYIDERIGQALADAAANGHDNEAPWLSVEQAAARLDCSADAIRMRVKRGRLEGRHVGRRLYVSRASVDGSA